VQLSKIIIEGNREEACDGWFLRHCHPRRTMSTSDTPHATGKRTRTFRLKSDRMDRLHPRNRYYTCPPDFSALAKAFPNFAK
jgi:hypothetical protein